MSVAVVAGTDLVLDVFRINGLLLAAGDQLTASQGLTAARWQVLGAIALAGEPLSVPRVARRMGLTRQSVQASVNRLVDDGLLAAQPNADHARSPLFRLTDSGTASYKSLQAAQQEWIDGLTTDIPLAELQAASRVLRTLASRLTTKPTRKEPA
ncbi:MAG TPA: MarR family transcriptional regulator [Pseudonocardia sp.]